MKNLLPIFALGFMACESSTSPGSVSSSTVQESSSSAPLSSSAVAVKCPYVADSVYGVTVDPRDGQCYRTVQVGNRIWWKDPLKYQISGAKCYYMDAGNCKGGLFYTWEEAMNGWQSSNNMPSGVQGLCPDGWVLPSQADWKHLYYQRMLDYKVRKIIDTEDMISLSAKPAGFIFSRNWSSTELSVDSAARFYVTAYGVPSDHMDGGQKNDSASIRCMKVVDK